ncbi:MAG: 4Fe-4S dicluster domain-containing protein [Deltaproteobacteria bacterium]|nr:4Fe-4S dicluster domain-containing protein [Deltaproteobacteria bacterium]
MSVSRRGWLTGLVAGAGVLAAPTAQGSGTTRFSGHPGRFGLLHDTTLCAGCRACEHACAQVNGLPKPTAAVGDASVFAHERRTTDKALTVVNRYVAPEGARPGVYRKQQCMHCNEPCCATVCLVKAFTKTPEGPVLYNPDVCMGCRYCVTACPYYALAYEYDDPLKPRVMRCTMCYARIKEGKNPGCADACPTGAILFGKRSELLEVARDRIRKDPGRYVHRILGEDEFGGSSWLVLAGMDFARLGLGDLVDATTTPLPEIATSYLSVVPLVITIYPGLLMGMHAFSKRKEEVAHQERVAAVSEALAKANEETRTKLAEAAQKAEKQKDAAVAQAVKKALAEAEAAAQKEGAK